MKNLPLFFFGILFAMAFAWTGIILTGHLQYGDLGTMTPEKDPDSGGPIKGDDRYPFMVSGLARQGKHVYIEMGCLYCHTQQTRRPGYGADYERGWARRQSVARDYIRQDRVLLGTMRTGPDLMTVGERLSDPVWHHLHLYNPQSTSEGSNMPPFAFLYEKREIGSGYPSPDALPLPEPYGVEAGYEVVPTKRAEALVAYLLSLRLDYELPESRFKKEE